MKLYIPPQLKRLSIAFAVFIALFLVLRHFLVPDTFYEYGFYRGASLADNQSLPVHYAGQKACFECHQDIEDLKITDVHKTIRCETCHGPGQKHAGSGDATDIFKPSERESCTICHAVNAAKNKEVIMQIDPKEHNTGKKCIECHNPHQPWKMKE
jgi:hypothetical protein